MLLHYILPKNKQFKENVKIGIIREHRRWYKMLNLTIILYKIRGVCSFKSNIVKKQNKIKNLLTVNCDGFTAAILILQRRSVLWMYSNIKPNLRLLMLWIFAIKSDREKELKEREK